MANRVYLKAPSVSDVRNKGLHDTLSKTIDKRYNLEDLNDKNNLMIAADLNDNLKRDILINPVRAKFGSVKAGCMYEMKITV